MTNSPTASPGKSPSSASRFQEMTSGAFKHGRSTFNSSNPNSSWLFVKGFICWYIFIIASIHILMLALPFKGLTVPWIWTLTSLIHAVGAPFPTIDSQNRFQTQWEQLDEEEGYQYNRKALNTIPVLLFLLAVTKTSHDNTHFMLNFLALAICIVPKMNVMRETMNSSFWTALLAGGNPVLAGGDKNMFLANLDSNLPT
eukprot:gene12601-6601_t